MYIIFILIISIFLILLSELNLKLVTLNIPQAYLDGIEQLVEQEIYPNRSETIRIAVRDFLRKEYNGEKIFKIKS
jgi:antitoxin ParD1/3/4